MSLPPIRKECTVLFGHDRGVTVMEDSKGDIHVHPFRPLVSAIYKNGKDGELCPSTEQVVDNGKLHTIFGFTRQAMDALVIAYERLTKMEDGTSETITARELDLGDQQRKTLITKSVSVRPII